MSFFNDFNDAPEQRGFELVPDGTILPLRLTFKPGGEQEFTDGYGKVANSGVVGLECELTVLDGPHKGRKIFDYMMVKGEDTDGHNKAVEITRARVRAILESARGISPTDDSDKAKKARQISGWGALDGIAFVGVAGIEKGKPVNPNDPQGDRYPDRNRVKGVITPDRDEWQDVSSFTTAVDKAGGSKAAGKTKAIASGGGSKPAWA